MVEKTKATTEPPDEKGKREPVPLLEHGPSLPLGIMGSAGFSKGMACRPWRMKEEKELSQLVSDTPDMNIAQHVAAIIGTMYTTLGPHDFTRMKEPEKRIIITQMYMGDVWYAYVYLRTQALGPELAMMIKCDRCSTEYPFPADLHSVEVVSSDDLNDLLWDFELRDPIQLRGKEVKKFRMGPQRWQMLEETAGISGSVPKEVAIRGSIIGINDEADGVAISSQELDELTKYDIESAASVIDKHYLGPNMSIELGGKQRCPHCRNNEKRRVSIDWRYDNFFAVSSQ